MDRASRSSFVTTNVSPSRTKPRAVSSSLRCPMDGYALLKDLLASRGFQGSDLSLKASLLLLSARPSISDRVPRHLPVTVPLKLKILWDSMFSMGQAQCMWNGYLKGAQSESLGPGLLGRGFWEAPPQKKSASRMPRPEYRAAQQCAIPQAMRSFCS